MDGSDVTANGVTQAIQDAVNNGNFGNVTVETASVNVDGMTFSFTIFV